MSICALTRSKLHDLLAKAGVVTKPTNLPYLSIGDLFKGRETQLDALTRVLGRVPESDATPVVVAVLNGLGGIGKTRLALDYAWRRAYGLEAASNCERAASNAQPRTRHTSGRRLRTLQNSTFSTRSSNSSTENVVSSSGAAGSSMITAREMTSLMLNGVNRMPSTTR